MYYYQRHINDYRAHAAHLSLLEHGILTWLTDTYYMTEQPLPTDEKKLHRLAMVKTKAEKQALKNVLEEFFVCTESGWVNQAFDEEITVYQTKLLAQSENGKKGGRPKKPSESQAEAEEKANQNPSESQKKPNHKPITINHKPNIKTYNAPAVADAPKSAKASELDLLLANGVNQATAQDYLQTRKSKRAGTLTQTALNGIIREAKKAGLSLEQALTVCCERSWIGFNAQWLHNTMFGNPVNKINQTPVHTQGGVFLASEIFK